MRTEELKNLGTYSWAAELLGVSIRQVSRYVADGKLTAVDPLCGRRETKRAKRMVYVDEVLELSRARRVMTRG